MSSEGFISCPSAVNLAGRFPLSEKSGDESFIATPPLDSDANIMKDDRKNKNNIFLRIFSSRPLPMRLYFLSLRFKKYFAGCGIVRYR